MIGASRNHFPVAFEKSIVASVAQRDCTHSFHTWPPPLYAFYSAWYTPNSPSIVGKSLYTTILLSISLYHYFPLYLYLGYLLYSVFPGIVYTIVYMYTLYVSSSHGESSRTNFCENGSNFRMLFWKQFCPDLCQGLTIRERTIHILPYGLLWTFVRSWGQSMGSKIFQITRHFPRQVAAWRVLID